MRPSVRFSQRCPYGSMVTGTGKKKTISQMEALTTVDFTETLTLTHLIQNYHQICHSSSSCEHEIFAPIWNL